MELLTIAFRTMVMFLVVLATMRLLGKRQMGELELNELVVAIMLSELAVSPITNPERNLLHGIVPILVLLVAELLITYFSMKHVRVRAFLVGEPSIVIRNGQINQQEMRKNRVNITELIENLRNQGITDFSTLKYAILEVNGTISVIPYTAHTPATHMAHQLESQDNGLPVVLINDGRVIDQNLKAQGLDRNWLDKELANRGIKKSKDVFLLSIDENQNIYFAVKTLK